MAKPEMMIRINLEPSEETLLMSKRMLEMWVNADSRRDILVRKRYTDDGQEIYLELVRENNEPQTETS